MKSYPNPKIYVFPHGYVTLSLARRCCEDLLGGWRALLKDFLCSALSCVTIEFPAFIKVLISYSLEWRRMFYRRLKVYLILLVTVGI